MAIECPRCKHPLFVEIVSTQVFSAEEITVTDVRIGERVDEKLEYVLRCMNCKFSGWANEYRHEMGGARTLFDKDGKITCTCSKQ
jgi:hypothetical protein